MTAQPLLVDGFGLELRYPMTMDEPARGRKHFLMRVEPSLFDALQRWAAQEMRSVNAQIEWILRDAVLRRERSGASSQTEGDATEPRAPASGPTAGAPPA